MSDAKSGLEAVLAKITDVPALPSIVMKLTRLLTDPASTVSEINDALSADPGLVTKVLKMVNSAYYGFSRRITTITNAVVILGFNQIRDLALSAFIFDSFVDAGKGYLEVNDLWKHCMGTAFLSAEIARSIDPKLEESAFLCGLLHDVGKFIMAQNMPEHVAKVVYLVSEKDILFYTAEEECLNYNHAILGAAIMERWNLPAIMVDVVKCHHDPLNAPEQAQILSCVTNLADITARAMLMGNGGDNQIPDLHPNVWKCTRQSWESLDGIVRKVAEHYSTSDAFFSIK